MKIVQTFWPGKNAMVDSTLKNSFGWLSPMHHYMSWALSVSRLRAYYDEVVLYTNSVGKQVLIDIFELPYTSVVTDLDNIPPFPEHLWALSKIYTYQFQDRPFMHVDGDIFIWDKLFQHNPVLLAQNVETEFAFNNNAIGIAARHGINIPGYIVKEDNSYNSANAGLFGGTDTDFIQVYCHEALSFFEQNRPKFSSLVLTETSELNALIEQIVFYYLAKQSNKEITYYKPFGIKTQYYKGFVDFEQVPHSTRFIHTLGMYKKNRLVCRQLSDTLAKYHEDLHTTISREYKSDYSFWVTNNPIINSFNTSMKTCI